MRAIWKGRIQFGPVDVPVKLYSAIRDIKIHSRLLHDQDQVPLKQKMVCPKDDEVIGSEDTIKAYEITSGEYVLIEADELDFTEPEASRQIDVFQFFDQREIDHNYLDRTYYLGPDNDDQLYANMLASLKENHLAGICQWVMRKKSYLGVLQFSSGIITLTTHRYSDEIIPLDSFEIEQVDITEKEIRVANNIVSELQEDFRPERYKDEYQVKLQKLIDRKAKNEEVRLPALEKIEKTEDEELLNALEQSLQSIKKGK